MSSAVSLPSDLTPTEIALLSFIALWGGYTSQSYLLKFLVLSGVKAPDGMAFSQPKLKLLLNELRLRQLVELHEGMGYLLHSSRGLDLKWALLRNLKPDELLIGINTIRQILAKEGGYHRWQRHPRSFCQREMFFAALLNNVEELLSWRTQYFSAEPDGEQILAYVFFEHTSGLETFVALDLRIQQILLQEVLMEANSDLILCTSEYNYCCALQDQGVDISRLAPLLATQALYRGDFAGLQLLTDAYPEFCSGAAFALATMQGNFDLAMTLADKHLKDLRKSTGKRKVFMPDFGGMIYLVLLLGKSSPASLKLAHEFADFGEQTGIYLSYSVIMPFVEHLATGVPLNAFPRHSYDVQYLDLDALFTFYAMYWQGIEANEDEISLLKEARQEMQVSGYLWLVAELDQLLKQFAGLEALLPDWHQQHALVPLLQAVQKEESWQRALKALVQLKPDSGSEKNNKAERLVWFLTMHGSQLHVEPREQKLSAAGRWSKGRPVALKRLLREPETVPGLTGQDKQVVACIQRFENYRGSTYELNMKEALPALIGHPAVFWADAPDSRVDLAKAEVVLQLKEKAGHISLQLDPPVPADNQMLWRKETPTKVAIYQLTPAVKQVAVIVAQGVKVPVAAKAQLVEAISAIAPVLSVHSDLPELSAALPDVPADSCLYAHLLPYSQGLRLQISVRPLADGSWFTPGKGSATLVGEQKGKAVQTSRNLKQEKASFKKLLQACPAIEAAEQEGEQWLFAEPEHSLELLTQLKVLPEADLQMVWPEGEKFRLKASRTLKEFSLSIKKQGDWFIADGEIQLDDNKVIALKELLQMVAGTSGRFLKLSDTDYLALTESLRKRLAELGALGEQSKTGLRFNHLTLPALSELTAEVGQLKTDKAWKEQLNKFEALADFEPALPSTLQTELRDYQLQGYQWLARLAQWGVGACLADDMGLGKTVQSLALLLQRAPQGPALVVAPVSVAMNWQAEVLRFAPTLNVRLYQQNRSLENLGAFDLVIASYGMLQSDSELFQAQHWHTLVLDEAQAIKNEQTKRSQAAMALQADFRMIATGTPVENHLGELWNLFRFINPGLLGSKDQFNQRFSSPIENGDKAARLHLKKLIQPFILRRTKTQVLSELPSRTEITLQVELSDDERHYYEALRQQAIENVELVAADKGKAMQVLAEITKLRRFCCHPQLVAPNSGMTGSKLAVFIDTVEELLDNKHKVLVFSQFVDHLAIVRTVLEQKQISYQYLDGSTPALERKKRVDAFQAGEGEVFLISLKAGGTGLNLTAADYVIHLDPWWNPAVEDQASDRAHRMGQTRPVTIYRLVTQNTIEERIIALHGQKRDLADSLLEGGDVAARLDTAALLKLLKELD
ncbi:MAG: DEAD/DEAH box helicase [Gammaproteobacteria bacterium]|nr:DEAD/DEAH box helicase [Gammaproteobacteria bacterium]MBU2056590.1 DEAD/DEAH box helicase [Gammaproteobacteria bacterium]MBU2173607.1 DEAD/DEAH box helicase [Gammaproteobacteria bacterium]MBU2247388.1 DEAD/DEAH box helicase [Gammaproteobacteria bacterium]MBU2343544.1 DEAD/DEAH box helicase [Gammaproteobacteria bacterium]